MTPTQSTRPWLIAIIAFALVLAWPGLFSTDQVLGGYDARGLFLPWWSTWREAIYAGRLPLWDSNVFAGYPFFANPQVALWYPPAWLNLILPTPLAIGWFTALHVAFAGIGMLYLTTALDADPAPAGLAGLAFCGFSFSRVYVGHVGLMAVLAWAPWLLLAALWATRRPTLRRGLMASLAWAGAVLAGHTTSTIYLGVLWVGFLLYLLIDGHRLRDVLRQFGLMLTVGSLLTAIQSLPLIELVALSQRQMTFEQATLWSLPPVQLIGFIMPEFFGEPVTVGYWGGPNFEELTVYIGILPLFGLALLKPTRRTAFWLALAGLGLVLAFGRYTPLYTLLWNTLPGFDLLRVPARGAFLTIVALPVLLALGLSDDDQPVWAVPLMALALVIVTLAATRLDVGAAAFPPADPGQLAHRASVMGRALVLIVASAALLMAYQRVEQKALPAVALAALLAADLFTFGWDLRRTEPTQPIAFWRQASTLVDGRVIPWGLGLFEQNGAAAFDDLSSVFGYNALEVGHMQGLASTGGDPRAASYDVLAAQYILTGWPAEEYDPSAQSVPPNPAVWVHERPTRLPVVRGVAEAVVIPDAEQALETLITPEFDAATSVILDRPLDCPAAQATDVTINAARPGYWNLRVEAPTLLVMAETDYPGWRITNNGQAVEHARAYTALKAVCVEAGEVELRFVPASFVIGAAITFGVIGMLAYSVLRTHEQEPPHE